MNDEITEKAAASANKGPVLVEIVDDLSDDMMNRLAPPEHKRMPKQSTEISQSISGYRRHQLGYPPTGLRIMACGALDGYLKLL